MRLFNNRSVDAVVSLGFNCRCALYLRKYKLRDCSSPFDWLTDASLETKVDTLCRSFDGFLDKSNLVFVDERVDEGVLKEHDRYEDRVGGYVFLHDFPIGVPLDESYPEVRARYDRRIARLLDRLNGRGSVLFVWWGLPRVPDASLAEAVRRMNECFPKSRIFLLAIDSDGAASVSSGEVPGSDGMAWRVSGPFVTGELNMAGDARLCEDLFQSIRLSGAWRNKIRWGLGRFAIHALIWYLPTKSLRRRFKAWLEPIFLGPFV